MLATKCLLLEVPSNSKYVSDGWRLGGNSQCNQCHCLNAHPSIIYSWKKGEWISIVNLYGDLLNLCPYNWQKRRGEVSGGVFATHAQ